MRPVACPLGFTERDLPAGAELPAAWLAPPAQAVLPRARARADTPPPAEAGAVEVEPSRHHATSRNAGPPPARASSMSPPDQVATREVERDFAAPVSVEVSFAAGRLYDSPVLQLAARREHDHDVGVGNGQLASACYMLLGLGFVTISAELPPGGLAVAALCGAALGAYAHHQFGRGPNLRRSRRHLAAGRSAAAEPALGWHPARGEALLQLAEVRRRQRQWRGAAIALLRLLPQTQEQMQAWGHQLEAVAARHAGALEDLAVVPDAELASASDERLQNADDRAPAEGASSGRRVRFVESRSAG